MEVEKKINVFGVLSEGIGIGLKNAPSLLGAVILWILTIWIPYINVGTTIAMNSIPIALSSGKIISPTFIFDRKYREFIGEYFMLQGLMSIAVLPAMMFMIIPGIVVAIAWSLAVYILIDKQVTPTKAITMSNKATLGYKWTIFGVMFLMMVALAIIIGIFMGLIGGWFGGLIAFLAMIAFVVGMLGCNSVIYRNLVKNEETVDTVTAAEEVL